MFPAWEAATQFRSANILSILRASKQRRLENYDRVLRLSGGGDRST